MYITQHDIQRLYAFCALKGPGTHRVRTGALDGCFNVDTGLHARTHLLINKALRTAQAVTAHTDMAVTVTPVGSSCYLDLTIARQ